MSKFMYSMNYWNKIYIFCCDNQVACLVHVIAENLVKCCETLVDCVDSRVHILSS